MVMYIWWTDAGCVRGHGKLNPVALIILLGGWWKEGVEMYTQSWILNKFKLLEGWMLIFYSLPPPRPSLNPRQQRLLSLLSVISVTSSSPAILSLYNATLSHSQISSLLSRIRTTLELREIGRGARVPWGSQSVTRRAGTQVDCAVTAGGTGGDLAKATTTLINVITTVNGSPQGQLCSP